MQEFITAAREAVEDENGEYSPYLEFTHDGRSVRLLKPSAGTVGLLVAETARGKSIDKSMAGVIEVFFALFPNDPDDDGYPEDQANYTYFRNRLMDPTDPFELEQIVDICKWLVTEVAGGRPTVKRSGSRSSQRTAGKKSTQRTPA